MNLPGFHILQIKIEQILAIAVSVASAALGWYAAVNAQIGALETELKLKDQQLHFYEQRADQVDKRIEIIQSNQAEMHKDINQIKIILERKADRQ